MSNQNVAFIPVRGGSKSIPLKNIKPVAGKPLVYWTVSAACECDQIDAVYVSTDDERIKKVVSGFGLNKVIVIDRSKKTATDSASTESALLEFAKKNECENIVLIQATSPLLTSEDLSKGFEIYNTDNIDSVISVVRQKRFIWNEVYQESGIVLPVNYDLYNRPRRQEFEGFLVENGAFYITSKEALLKSKNRVSGTIGFCEMSEDTYHEMDEPGDWIVIEQLLKNRIKPIHRASNKLDFSKIKMVLTDCDGVLTDGGMYYSENGDELKKFNTRDGVAFHLLKEKGIITGIITGEDRELNIRRAQKIQVNDIVQGTTDKAMSIKKLCKKYGINTNEVLYIGDDLNDLEAIKMVGIGCCPIDAVEEIRTIADVVSNKKGGEGVLRDLVRFL